MQLIPFESVKNVPAKAGLGNLADMLVHASSSYSVLSLKGKKFTKVAGGERTLIMNPKDPDSPATAINVVILGVSKVKPRVFYATAYNPDEAEGRKPDCMSSDGIKPDANSQNPQCKSCAACAHNVWGTKKRQDGTMGKGKACDETIRVAVAAPDRLGDPMLLKVPPSSLSAIPELGKFLRDRGFSNTYDIITKISFDPEADAQKLVFTPVGACPAEFVQQCAEAYLSEPVQKIINGDGAAFEGTTVEIDTAPPAIEAPKRTATKKQADAAIAKAAAAAAATPTKEVTVDEVELVVEAAEKPKAKAAPAPLEVDDLEIEGLDDLSFDDAADD